MSTAPLTFRPGDWVTWVQDNDEGLVTAVIAGQAIAIRWASTGHIKWYPIHCVALNERIEPLEVETADEIPA